MGEVVLRRVNELPAPTWNHLEINGCELVVPSVEGFVERAGHGAVEKGGAADVASAADDAAEQAGAAEAADAAEGFDAPEAAKAPCGPWADLADSDAAIAGGCGTDAAAWLQAASVASGGRVAVDVPDYAVAGKPYMVDLAQVGGVASVDVRVGDGASAKVVLLAGRDVSGVLPAGDGEGIADGSRVTGGWSVRIDAGRDARVEVLSFVAPGAGIQMIDDMGVRAADGAHVDVRQFFLGADVLASGFAADLAGERSALSLDARYVGRGEEVLDLGYAVRNRGRRSECDLAMRGVLSDAANKSLRTTIDLVRGAKGARGVENESVVVAGDAVVNKSLPVILCDEDDVAGTHGASIGEVDPAQLAYLATRGIDAEEARALIMEATYTSALQEAEIDDAVRAAVYAATAEALGPEVAAELAG